MAATANAVAQSLQRAARTRWFDGIRAKCLGYSILQLFQRAPEDLPARLEFGPKPEKAEAVVAGKGEPPGERPQQPPQLAPRPPPRAARPHRPPPRGAGI